MIGKPCDQGPVRFALEVANRGEAVEVRRLLRKPADLRGQRHGHGCALPGAAWAGQSPENTRQAGLGGNPAHGEERLRLFVVGRQIIIGQRPSAASVSRLGSKLLSGKAQQGGAVPLGLAADVDVFLGLQRTALAVHPRLPRQEFPAVDDAFNIEGTAINRQMGPLLQVQHTQAAPDHAIGRGGATGTGTDDDGIVGCSTHAGPGSVEGKVAARPSIRGSKPQCMQRSRGVCTSLAHAVRPVRSSCIWAATCIPSTGAMK